jgi:hypothetical protein
MWALAVVLTAVVAGSAALLWRWRRAPHRVVNTDGAADLAGLLRGALLRPRAFGRVAALYSRPLVPLIAGRRVTLPAAVERARAGRLFRGTALSDPVVRAVRRRAMVIDVDLPEGEVVADILGARDLDAWHGLDDTIRANPATEGAERALTAISPGWKIRIADDPPQPVSIIESHLVGVGGRGRVAMVDASGPLWTAASSRMDSSPAWAAFVLADGLAAAMDLRPRQRRRWLTGLAEAAVAERRREAM